MMRRLLPLLLILLLLCGCNKTTPEEDINVCSRGDTAYTLPMFRYTVAILKTRYLSDYYEQKGEIERFEDVPSLWDAEHESGTTVGDAVHDIAVNTAKTTVYYASVAKENGLILTKNELAAIRNSVKKTKALFEDEDDFNDYLAAFGMTEQTLEDYYTLEAYAEAAKEYLYGTGGTKRVSEEEAKEYFDTRFATVNHIFLSYESGWEQKRDEVIASLDSGGSMTDFKTYSDDNFFDSFPNGMLLYAGSTEFTAYENTALSLEIGKHTQLIDTDGVYIIRRLSNDPAAYTAPISENTSTTVRELIFTLLTDEKMKKAVLEADLVLDQAALEKVTVTASPLIQ